MPTSTQKGFTIGKWELYYLQGRYKSHRNKVAAAQPAIDSKPPVLRPHVQYKQKKGLDEKQRQTDIMIENLRILNKTSEIMNDSDFNYFHQRRVRPQPDHRHQTDDDEDQHTTSTENNSKSRSKMKKKRIAQPSASASGPDPVSKSGKRSTTMTTVMRNFHEEQLHQRQSQPITLIMKKNSHVMLRWFLRRFGEYVPWWAELTY